MAYSAKLCNPTQWACKIDWDRGIKIRVPAFGETALTMQQMDDFRGDKPGSEDVQSTMNAIGVFLYDTDRPYDNQAVEALERMHKALKAQFDAMYKNLIDQRAAAGIAPNEEALEELVKTMGLATLRDKVTTLKKQAALYRTKVSPEQRVRESLDPARTIFVLDPPRQFPSVTAMEFFLAENSEVKAAHEAFLARSEAAAEEDTVEASAELQEAF
jgi:hypothetical protein